MRTRLFALAGAFLGLTILLSGVPVDAQNLDVLAKRLSQTVQTVQLRSVVVSDFVDERGRVTVQGALLSDRIWFAILANQKGFETLNRILLQQKQYSLKPSFDNTKSFEKAALESARAIGADVLITGVITEGSRATLKIAVLRVSTREKLEQLEESGPSSKESAILAQQLVYPYGPIHLIGQDGVNTPSCAYCPTPRYTEPARQNKVEGKVVVTVVINSEGRPQEIWKTKGLPDGLTEQALKTVKSWRFKPTHDAKGKPVAVIVPVDVAFLL